MGENMDAYRAVISLHNLGYQLKALGENRVAIMPAAKKEHAELIKAIRNEPEKACNAIQHLPRLCVLVASDERWLREYLRVLFSELKEIGYCRILAIRFYKATGQTEYVVECLDAIGYRTLQEISEEKWGDFYECKEERERWRT